MSMFYGVVEHAELACQSIPFANYCVHYNSVERACNPEAIRPVRAGRRRLPAKTWTARKASKPWSAMTLPEIRVMRRGSVRCSSAMLAPAADATREQTHGARRRPFGPKRLPFDTSDDGEKKSAKCWTSCAPSHRKLALRLVTMYAVHQSVWCVRV
jgi:hypothetical protein